jgi:hypothetical protein
MFFELIVNYERARIFFIILVKINFLNFMALNEVYGKIDCTRLKPYLKGM